MRLRVVGAETRAGFERGQRALVVLQLQVSRAEGDVDVAERGREADGLLEKLDGTRVLALRLRDEAEIIEGFGRAVAFPDALLQKPARLGVLLRLEQNVAEIKLPLRVVGPELVELTECLFRLLKVGRRTEPRRAECEMISRLLRLERDRPLERRHGLAFESRRERDPRHPFEEFGRIPDRRLRARDVIGRALRVAFHD